jgi:hypothetical protein
MPQKEGAALFREMCGYVSTVFPLFLKATGDPMRALDMVAEAIRNLEPTVQRPRAMARWWRPMTDATTLAGIAHRVHSIGQARGTLASLLDDRQLSPTARAAVEAVFHGVAEAEAAERGAYEAAGGLPAHLDCGVYPPCEVPGGPECECIGS